jgi:hypothetical protein
MSTSGTTRSAASTATSGVAGRRPLAVAAAAASVLCVLLAGCTSAPDSAAPPAGGGSSAASPAGGDTSGTASPAADALVVTITEANGEVSPNGQKLEARVGQQVVLDVTSDQDDEIHAHTGGEGYELEVKAGQPAHGTFTLTTAGSFEVESHELEKVIVVLNAR